MAEITAALVKELRERTGAGMMECKKALVEADGDMDAAIDVLRTRGLAAVAKKAGRETNEGVVAAYLSDDGTVGSLVEVNCETDFVGRNEKFQAFANELAQAAAQNDPADLEAFRASMAIGRDETVEAIITDAVHTFGENIQVPRFARVAVSGTGALSTYIHGGGRIGVIVECAFNNAATAANDTFKQFARDIAMQVAAAMPITVSRDDVSPEVVEHEMGIYRAQAAESGKPEAIQEKMATGRLEKFFKESTLLEQAFVKDPDKNVAAYAKDVSGQVGDEIEIVGFVRFGLGETFDK